VTSGCLVILVCFQVNHGSVIITVDTSESRDQTCPVVQNWCQTDVTTAARCKCI